MATEVNSRDYAADVENSNTVNNNSNNANPATVSRLTQEAAQGQGAGVVQPEAAQGAQELADSAEAGANVHAFNPDEDPAAKAAKARQQAKAALQPVDGAQLGRTNKGAEVTSDVGLSKDAPKPTTGLSDALKASEGELAAADEAHNTPSGVLKDGHTADLPDFYKVGWTAFTNRVSDAAANATIDDKPVRDFVGEFLDAQYFGTVWHNAGIVFFAVFASHFVTRFNAGYGMLFVILAACAAYYSSSIRRVRQRARDDISRELAKQRLYKEHESADWINNFLARFWKAYEPLLSATVVMSVDQVLSESCPAFLESLRLTTFTLGTKAPRIDFVRTFADTDDNTVVMDMKVSFTPNDVHDLTPRQLEGKVNPKIVLAIRFGKGVATLGKDVVVEDISFSGLLRFRFKLMSNFPNVKTVEFSFMEKPVIDFVLKPIGFDLSLIPGLDNFIDSQVHANMGPMMYDPNSFAIDLEAMLSGVPIDTAIGVLQVTLFNARGLKATKIGGGTPDPYVSFSISNRAEVARSKTKHSTTNPKWNETKYMLINSLSDVLTLQVFDWNDHRNDTELGVANFDLKTVEDAPEQELVVSKIMSAGKERGDLQFAVNWYPVLQPKKTHDGSHEPVPESRSGIVKLTVHQAKELDRKQTVAHSQINPYARIMLQGKQISTTRTLKRTITPAWEHSTECLVTDRPNAIFSVKIVDERGASVDPVLGYVNVPLEDLLEAKEKSIEWFPLSGANSGKIRISAEFKPVLMSGAVNGSRGYTSPIGIVKVLVKRASDLKNVEAFTGGKSDPYIRALSRGTIVDRTEVHDNNLNPTFEEYLYVPVHSPKDRITLEAMDYQSSTKDRTLGWTFLQVGDLVQEGQDKNVAPWVSKGTVKASPMLSAHAGSDPKGTLYYEATFFTCSPMPGLAFDPPESANEHMETASISSVETKHEKDVVDHRMQRDLERIRAQNRARSNTETSVPEIAVNGENKKSLEGSNAEPSNAASTAVANDGPPAIPREELLKTPSGVLAINVIEGQIAKRGARLEILFDSAYWPSYTTEAARSAHATWDEVAEHVVKEREYSRIMFKLNSAEKETIDEVFAETSLTVDDFLERALDTPVTLTLTGASGEYKSTIKVAAKFIPIQLTLEPQESINNTGNLQITIASANDLRSADRNGYSDPYAQIQLNGEKLMKTQVKKKTLKPVWNETFAFPVPSRVAAECLIKLYDWDTVGSPDKLGQCRLDLAALQPLEKSEVTMPLFKPDGSPEKGTVTVAMVFRPEFINRSRAATSTFSAMPGRALTGVGGVGKAGVKGVAGVGKFAGKGAGSLAYRIGHGGHGRKSSVATANGSLADNSMLEEVGGGEGILLVTVSNPTLATGDKAHAIVLQNGKQAERSHDQYKVPTDSRDCELTLQLMEHKTFGRDKILGAVDVSVWELVGPLVGQNETEQTIPVQEAGQLDLKLSWTPTPKDLPPPSSPRPSSPGGGRPESIRSQRTRRFSRFLPSTPEKSR